MPIRFRPGVTREPWTPRGLEVQANIAERTRRITPDVNGGMQRTLSRFAEQHSFYTVPWN